MLCPLYPISAWFWETHLTYLVLWSSWRGLCWDQSESGLCTGGHHADISCDHTGRPGPASVGGAREVWTGPPDANERDPRRAKQNSYPHQRLGLWLWVTDVGRCSPRWSWRRFVIWALFPAVPKVQFRDASYVGNENSGQISAVVYRSGDISYKSTVRCYSRQGTAQVMMDFNERPNTDASVITFLPGSVLKHSTVLPLRSLKLVTKLCYKLCFFSISSLSGETEKPCTLILVDDTEHEEDEELRLVLGSPKSESPFGASVGGQNETLLKIKDDADSKSTWILSRVICQLPTLAFNLAESLKNVIFWQFNLSAHFFLFPQNNIRLSRWNMLKEIFL